MNGMSAAGMLDHPNLLLVGFVKCGTTSLAKYLTDHPRIASPIAKELYVLVDRASQLRSMQPVIGSLAFSDGNVGTGRDYIEFFPSRAGCHYALDATPFYYSQQAALQYARTHADVRIIFMLRNPAARLYSSFQYFQNVFQEYPGGTFEEFVNALLDDGATRARYRRKIRKPFFQKLFDDELEMGNYEKHIARWTKVIDGERIYIGRLEDMNAAPREFMYGVCNFLGLERKVYRDYEFRSYMRSYRVRIPWLQTLARRLGREDPIRYDRMREYQNPFHRVPNRWLRNGLDDLYGRVQRKGGTTDVGADTWRRLGEYYEPANAMLLRRYGIDYTLAGKGGTMPAGFAGRPQEPVDL